MARLFQSVSRRNQLLRAAVSAAATLALAAFCGCATPTENDLPSEDVGGAPGTAGRSQTVAGASFAGASLAGGSGAGAPSAGAPGASGAASGGASSGGASSSAGAHSGGAAAGGTGSGTGGAPGTAGAGQAAAGAPSAGASSGGATGGGSCAAAYSSSACLNLSVGTKVSSGGHNWTCANDNCRNCDNHPECAPGMTSCPWGTVWTDNGSCG